MKTFKELRENKRSIKEAQENVDFVIDQLSNSMEYYDEDDFIEMITKEFVKKTPADAKRLWDAYWKLDATDRMSYSSSDWKRFITDILGYV